MRQHASIIFIHRDNEYIVYPNKSIYVNENFIKLFKGKNFYKNILVSHLVQATCVVGWCLVGWKGDFHHEQTHTSRYVRSYVRLYACMYLYMLMTNNVCFKFWRFVHSHESNSSQNAIMENQVKFSVNDLTVCVFSLLFFLNFEMAKKKTCHSIKNT